MQKITTPKGETLVVLPIDEYEKLVDRADIAEAEAVHRNIAAGVDELIPDEIVEQLLSGENPVRIWRRFRGLAAREVAQAAGISSAYLSEIETGRKKGSLQILTRIAAALSVDLDDIV